MKNRRATISGRYWDQKIADALDVAFAGRGGRRMALIQFEAFSEVLGKAFSAQIALPETNARPLPRALASARRGRQSTPAGFATPPSSGRPPAATWRWWLPRPGMSMYEDMAHGQRYFTHIADELPGMLRRLLPLSDKREDNFIAGLSMGGMGALKIAMRRPESYAAVCCLSAGHTNYRFHEPREGTPRFNRYLVAYGEAGPLPSEEETLARARALAEAGGPCPRVWHACGEQDSLKTNAALTRDFFRKPARQPLPVRIPRVPRPPQLGFLGGARAGDARFRAARTERRDAHERPALPCAPPSSIWTAPCLTACTSGTRWTSGSSPSAA